MMAAAEGTFVVGSRTGGGDALAGDDDDRVGDGRSAVAVDECGAIDDGGLGHRGENQQQGCKESHLAVLRARMTTR